LSATRVRIELAEALHLFSNLAGLAKVLGFRILQRGRIASSEKVCLGSKNELFQ